MDLFKKKYHWYTVEFKYRNNKSQLVFDWNDQLGLRVKKDILNLRSLKKTQSNVFKQKDVKPLLCNGTLSVTILSYIGKFPKRK